MFSLIQRVLVPDGNGGLVTYSRESRVPAVPDKIRTRSISCYTSIVLRIQGSTWDTDHNVMIANCSFDQQPASGERFLLKESGFVEGKWGDRLKDIKSE